MDEDIESKALSSIVEDSEKEEADKLFNPSPVQVIINIGCDHKEPDGDEGPEGSAGALEKLERGE